VNSSGDLGRLETRQWEQLQDMASRFEAAWQQSETADLAAFLPPPGNPLRRVALLELIKTDLEARWRRNQIIGVEAYLEKFPELGNAAILAPQLIYEEYRVRHLYGDKPPLAGYERRFPRQFPEFKRLVAEQPIPTAVGPAPESAPDMQSVAIDKVLRIGGGYKLIQRIGCGGFAEVWQAETPGGFPVAIKRLLRPLDHAEAQLELRALGEIKRLSHPYLLQTRDYDLLDNRLYIVMDLADCTLSDRLHVCKSAGMQGIPLDELFRYIREAAEAIDYMHGEKVHHRDIKPKNILLHKGHAKVADFGLARMIESQRMTVTGSGTAPYMAPEIWKRQFSDSSDLYSLAVSYVELRIGRMPFAGTDMYSLMMEHLEGKPNLDPMPEAEQEVLRKALSKDPTTRHSSCLAFVEALEAAVEPLQQQQPPISDSRRRRSTVQRRLANTEAIDQTMRPDDTPPQPPDDSDPTLPPPPTWRPRRMLGGPSWVLLAVLSGALVGLVGWNFYLKWFADFDVDAPLPFTFKAEAPSSIPVTVHRRYIDGPINFTYAADGVTIYGTAQPGSETAELNVTADKEALLGAREVAIPVDSGNRSHHVTLRFTVEPHYWKPNWKPAPDAKQIADVTGRRHYSAIDVDIGGIPVRFLLIPKELNQEQLPPTFYIMENKVWNALYARFAAEQPQKAGKTWIKGGARGAEEDKLVDIGNDNPRHPALRMNCKEAMAFAEWLGGRLASVKQWDTAAGQYRQPRGRGPFREPVERIAEALGWPNFTYPAHVFWFTIKRAASIQCNDPVVEWDEGESEVAINRKNLGPMPVGEAPHDVSVYGCRDLAGNGLEWTRTPGEKHRLAAQEKEQQFYYLRGARYDHFEPWLFNALDRNRMQAGELDSDPHYGFRVVLESE
jgi:serine/threonine protein kinase/formylglycine-generating enzyme required for sulfatase activity